MRNLQRMSTSMSETEQEAKDIKNITLRSIYDAMITSGVLEARQVVCPQVSKANLAGEAWYSATNRELLGAEQ